MWFVLISVVIVAITLLIRRHFNYWERLGLPSDKPVIPFGSIKDTVFGKKDVGSAIHDLHERYKKPFVGIYLLFKPTLLITDLELARQVLIQNFVSFHDRGIDSTVSPDLFSMRGASWKNLRSKLTPLFSSGKLKAMLPTIDDVAAKLLNHLNEQLDGKSVVEVEMKDVMTTYALDVIGSVFFGMDVDSFKNPTNEYRTVLGEVLSPSAWLDRIKSVAFFVCPPLSTFMEYCGYTPNGVVEIREIIKRVVNLREHKNVVRRDFIQLLLQLRNSNKITDDDNWSLKNASEDAKSMSIEMIGDQCSLFSIAGTETTAVTAAHTLYELSMYPELLTEAVAEVDSVLTRHGLKPSDPLPYEAIHDMKFLELCTLETLRKYPGLPFVNRECTQDFEIPNSDYTIKKGTAIMISLLGLHHDPEHFPNPYKYDPYRFTEESRGYNSNAYMPFGEGPHNCIAKRMGQLSSKIAIIKVLANFNMQPNECKHIEFDCSNNGVTPVVKGGVRLKLSKRIL